MWANLTSAGDEKMMSPTVFWFGCWHRNGMWPISLNMRPKDCDYCLTFMFPPISSHAQLLHVKKNVTFIDTGPEALPVSVCNCFLYFTCKENILKMFV